MRWRWIAICAVLVAMVAALAWTMAAAAARYAPDRSGMLRDVATCVGPEASGIEAIAGGACSFRTVGQGENLARGFSQSTAWLRLAIVNAEPAATGRWLRIGHARLQRVTLYRQIEAGGWIEQVAGIDVPMAQRPLAMSDPVFPVMLPAGASETVYVAVTSATALDLTPSLWAPGDYLAWVETLRLFQAAAYGALLLTAALTLILFGRLGERVYLYFTAAQLAAIAMDASYTGFLGAVLWPASMPFDIRLQSAASGTTAVFFMLFLMEFVPAGTRRSAIHRTLGVLLWAMVAVTLYACLVDYGSAVWVQATTGIAMVVTSIALSFKVWRDGLRPAGFLIIPYAVLAVMQLYRQTMAFGLVGANEMQQVGFGWCFVLVAPSILVAVIERSESLRRSAAEARSEALARMHLMAQMSHELRAPLTAILGFASLLRRNSPRTSAEEASRTIESESRRLMSMVDQLLDYSRGEVGQLELTPAPVRLADFLDEVARTAALAAALRGNRFDMHLARDLPDTVVLDAQRLRQVLDNLIGNAACYTANGRIELHCEPIRAPDGSAALAFEVADTGRGVSEEERERIFEPFVRGSAALANPGDGAGIGLALSRRLVALMGGTIAVDARTGGGSRFRFAILAPVPAPEAVAAVGRGARADLDRPPEDILASLRPLVASGAISGIEDWVDRFEATHPAHPSFAAALRSAASRLDFTTMRQLAGMMPRE